MKSVEGRTPVCSRDIWLGRYGWNVSIPLFNNGINLFFRIKPVSQKRRGDIHFNHRLGNHLEV